MPVFEQDNMAFKTNAGWMKRRPAIDKRNQIMGQVLPCAILEQTWFYNVQKLWARIW